MRDLRASASADRPVVVQRVECVQRRTVDRDTGGTKGTWGATGRASPPGVRGRTGAWLPQHERPASAAACSRSTPPYVFVAGIGFGRQRIELGERAGSGWSRRRSTDWRCAAAAARRASPAQSGQAEPPMLASYQSACSCALHQRRLPSERSSSKPAQVPAEAAGAVVILAVHVVGERAADLVT